MVEYIWKIEKIETIELKDYNDFISIVDWSISAKENNNIATEVIKFGYKYEDSSNYIPFNELTEDIVLIWVKDRLGENGVKHFQDLILNKLKDSESLTTKERKFPWDK